MAKHTMQELYQYQSLPLSVKIRMTQRRIRDWVDYYGESGVYISFSGGKDSTVLVDLVDSALPNNNIPLVFVDTGLEYPEIREFVKGYGDRVTWLKPKMTFKQVIETYGYPFISKEVSGTVYYARKYFRQLQEKQGLDGEKIIGAPCMADILGIERIEKGNRDYYEKLKLGQIPIDGAPARVNILMGTLVHKENGVATNECSKMYDKSRYKFFLGAPFEISNKCCEVMKKKPVKKYAKESGRFPMTGQMASESRLRTSQWLLNGCNGFDLKSPISNPMSFWTEQDVLQYILDRNISICSVYGDVVPDYQAEGQMDGQMRFDDLDAEDFGVFDLERPLLKTTGCNRTGCMFCGYGSHCKGDDRFERMKITHPKQYDYIMRPKEDGGLNYKEVIDWINENGNLNIRY